MDQCIFKPQDRDMFSAIHVDDGIIIGKEIEKIKQLQDKLKEELEITVELEPKSYLGMDIVRTKGGIIIP